MDCILGNPGEFRLCRGGGCEVYTGTRYLPDIDHFSLLAARGLDLATFNRLGYLDAIAIPWNQPSTFHLDSQVVVRWYVNANDPILRQLGIRYVAFDVKPAPDLSAGLRPISADAVDGFWLYELPDRPGIS